MNGKEVLESQIKVLQKMSAKAESDGNVDDVCKLSESIRHLVETRSNMKSESGS